MMNRYVDNCTARIFHTLLATCAKLRLRVSIPKGSDRLPVL
jgi:hypothetical protein